MSNPLKPFLDPQPVQATPPPEQRPEPPPYVSPTWLMVKTLLDWAKLPSSEDAKKLKTLGAEFTRTLKQLEPFGQDDAKKEFLRLLNTALDGKADPGSVPSRDEISRKFSITRQVIKTKASAISRQGCIIAANVLEDALKNHLPKYSKQALEQELLISPVVTHLGASPLKRLLEEMPKFLQVHIDKLRANETPMKNPANIFNFD